MAPRKGSRRKSRPNPQIPVNSGAWKGVKDVGDAGMQDPEYLQDAINCFFPDPQHGAGVYARPGFQPLTSSALAAQPQGFFGYTDFSSGLGVSRLFCIAGGVVYRQTGATTWTDVSPSGITVDGSVDRVYVIPFNGKFIVSDGVNEPWVASDLTSTPITGTEIEINTAGSAWFAHGKPTVHGGKVFFIIADIAGTKYDSRIAWSEEGDAATGYMQTGYTNFWDLIQSPVPAEKILAIQGSNYGLFYFRNLSIGVILGAVNADFVTASTHDGITSDTGVAEFTKEVCLARDYIWFVDTAFRPCRIRLGSRQVEPVGLQLRHRMTRMRMSVSGIVSDPHFAYSADLNKVVGVFLLHTGVSDMSKHLYVFDATTGGYEGRWLINSLAQPTTENPTAARPVVIQSLPRSDAVSSSDSGDSTFIVGGDNSSGTAGHIYHQISHKFLNDSTLSSADDGGMHWSITTMLHPDEPNLEFQVDEVVLEGMPDTVAVTLDYYTPYGSVTNLSATGKAASDSIQTSHDHGRFVWGLGPNAQGRWIRLVFHRNIAGGTAVPYAFERASALVRVVKAGPFAP